MMNKNRIIALIGLMCLQVGSMNAMEDKEYTMQKNLNKQLYDELISETGDPKRVTSLIESGADRSDIIENEDLITRVAKQNNPKVLRSLLTAVSPKDLYYNKGPQQLDTIVARNLVWAEQLKDTGYLSNIPEALLKIEIEESYNRVNDAQAKYINLAP
jgi:hypothetical protein